MEVLYCCNTMSKVEEFNYNHRSVPKCPHVGSAVWARCQCQGRAGDTCLSSDTCQQEGQQTVSTACCLPPPAATCPTVPCSIVLYIHPSEEPSSVPCSCAKHFILFILIVGHQIASLVINQHCTHGNSDKNR